MVSMATKTHLIGSTEAAEILSLSRATINRWAVEGKLIPVMKAPGDKGARFFKLSDVERIKEDLSRKRAA